MMETFAALDARLRAEGWERGLPRRRGLVDGPGIDAKVAGDATCDACGYVGLTFVPYVDPERRVSETGYCAVATCPACQWAEEF